MSPVKITALPAIAQINPDDILVAIDACDVSGRQTQKARVRDLFTDEDAATLHLVADHLEREGHTHASHLARLRRVAKTIRGLLQFDTPPQPKQP